MLLTGVTIGGSLDPDAQAYITAAGIPANQQAAINTYVLGLKAAGLWTKITARYITFNNATTAAVNIKNPSAFLATIVPAQPNVNAPTIDASGYAASATSYFRTGVIPNTHLSQYDLHFGHWRIGGSSTASQYEGIDVTSTNRLAIRNTGASAFANFYGNNTANYSATNVKNTYIVATNVSSAATGGKIYSNGTLLNSTSANSGGTFPTVELVFDGACTGSGSYTSFGGNAIYMMFTAGAGLTATDITNDFTLTLALKIALGL